MDDIPPLETEIRRLIAAAGPMPISQYMSLCLGHPQHGYYVTRDPFGVRGDFITAPEISQMFGELLGLWSVAVWQQMGAPERLHLIELGPGRGSLMRDALRASRVAPAFSRAVSVHLIEISPKLEGMQRQTLAKSEAPVQWHGDLADVPQGPSIILANEFLDALPVHQMVKQDDGWHERVVMLNAMGDLVLGVAPKPVPNFERILPRRLRAARNGALFEWRSDNVVLEIGKRVRDNGAALIIDYGHGESNFGDTLQAVGGHSFVDVLTRPGEVDLTAHVDFQAVAQAAESIGARALGPIEQGDLLKRLGIEARAVALAAAAPDKAAAIEAALMRLTQTGRTGMGRLFKALALADPKLGQLPGFESPQQSA